MVTLRLDDRTAALLASQARARGMSIENYIDWLARSAGPAAETLTPAKADLDSDLDRLFSEEHSSAHPLPADFSRGDIYNDHD